MYIVTHCDIIFHMAKNKNTKIIIGNWKMNPSSPKEAEVLFKTLVKNKVNKSKVEVVICPPSIYLERLYKISKRIPLGLQNVYFGGEGATTGEISAKMAENIGAQYIILGHSERRAMGETNEIINKKIKTVLYEGPVPILCVGEKVRDEKHEHFTIIKNQVEESLGGITKSSLSKVIIAYEPVWAIGNNALREARPEEFHEVMIFIRKVLSDKFGLQAGREVKIIYGGSVNPKNALGFLTEGQAEGFLVGRDSLDAKKFLQIIDIVESAI